MNNALTNAVANGGRNSAWKLPLKIFTAIFEPTSKAPLKGLRNPDTYFYHSFTFESRRPFSPLYLQPAPQDKIDTIQIQRLFGFSCSHGFIYADSTKYFHARHKQFLRIYRAHFLKLH